MKNKIVFCAKWGRPIERVEGSYIRNFIRTIMHCRKIKRRSDFNNVDWSNI